MSITELASAARALSLDERRELAQTLLEDLAKEEAEAMFRGRRVYHVYTPEFAPNAVAQMALVLKEDAKCRQS